MTSKAIPRPPLSCVSSLNLGLAVVPGTTSLLGWAGTWDGRGSWAGSGKGRDWGCLVRLGLATPGFGWIREYKVAWAWTRRTRSAGSGLASMARSSWRNWAMMVLGGWRNKFGDKVDLNIGRIGIGSRSDRYRRLSAVEAAGAYQQNVKNTKKWRCCVPLMKDRYIQISIGK